MEIDEKLLKQVYEMAKIGLTMKQVATILGRSRRSLFNDFEKYPELRQAYEQGVECGIDEVSQTAFRLAKSGKVPAMTMFWLKCRARWKEVQHVEVQGKVTLEDLLTASFNKNDEPKKTSV